MPKKYLLNTKKVMTEEYEDIKHTDDKQQNDKQLLIVMIINVNV